MTITRKNIAFVLALVFFASMLIVGRPASAQTTGPDVAPQLITGNQSCADLGFGDFELKVENGSPKPADILGNGTFTDDTLTVTISNYTGTSFSWASNLGVDAVLVKGGPNENGYLYDPPKESRGDDGLTTPTNPSNGRPFGISHISFCYDLELEVSKTADTSFTRTHNWTIDKSVTPGTWDLFRGDSGTSGYTVSVDKVNFTDSDHKVSGTISVFNPAPFAASVTGVSDVVSPAIAADVDCGASFPITLASKGMLECSYSADLPNGQDRVNAATATTNTLKLGNGSGKADVIFGAPTTVVNDSITVDDSFAGAGSPWTFSADGSQSYTRTFSCNGDEGLHRNTATIRETGQSDGASVTVNCYDLDVSKDANTSFTRTWTWTIDKSADQSELTLSVGQQFFPVNYSVAVDATSADSDHAVDGNITVSNPAPLAAELTSVSDVVSPAIAASVECSDASGPVSFPYTLAADSTLGCTYSASLPNDSSRTNTATATLQNNDYDSEGNATASGTTEFSGNAAVSFANATIERVDESITVEDTLQGPLGTATVGVDTLPKTFTYQRAIGPYTTSGDRTVDNTASFVTNDTGTTGSDSYSILVHVPANGCTLTIGYWKTHADPTSNRTNANATGELLPVLLGTSGGAKSVNVTTNAQAIQILSFNGEASNGINKLYAQLLAAKLNIKNGADGAAVSTTITAADNFLATKNAADWASLSRAQKNQVLGWATTLDNYNNGLIGPGHCSE